MSKLYNEYLRLKLDTSDDILLFKSGIFYIALNEDAMKLSELFNFKVTKLNEKTVKCGFPQTRLSYYSKILDEYNISFKIVDTQNSKMFTYSDFMKNVEFQGMIEKLSEIDMNSTTCLEAFNLLYDFSEIIKKLRKDED